MQDAEVLLDAVVADPVSVKTSPSKPDVWVSSWRTVMTLAASLSPISNSGRYVWTVASRSTLPSSTSCSTSELVQSLVIDPIWNTESVVASTPVDMLNSPAAWSTTSPSASTPTAAAGTSYRSSRVGRFSAIQSETSFSFVMSASSPRRASDGRSDG